MSARAEPLHGEVLDPAGPGHAPHAWHCRDCTRMMISEEVWITEEGELQCCDCRALDDLTD